MWRQGLKVSSVHHGEYNLAQQRRHHPMTRHSCSHVADAMCHLHSSFMPTCNKSVSVHPPAHLTHHPRRYVKDQARNFSMGSEVQRQKRKQEAATWHTLYAEHAEKNTTPAGVKFQDMTLARKVRQTRGDECQQVHGQHVNSQRRNADFFSIPLGLAHAACSWFAP